MDIDNIFLNTLNKPTLTSFSFTDEDSNIINEIKILEETESFDLYINAIFTGISSEYLNYNEPNESRYINFCVYETNKSGKGYRVIRFFFIHLDSSLMKENSIKVVNKILTIDSNFKPLQGEFHGEKFDTVYNFNQTYLSLKIFYSTKEIIDIGDLDRVFYQVNNVVLDTKLPIKTVMKNDK